MKNFLTLPLFSICVFCASVAFATATPIILRIQIELDGAEAPPDARAMLEVQDRDNYSHEKIEASLRRFAESYLYKSVRSSFEPSSGALTIALSTLEIVEGYRIQFSTVGSSPVPSFLLGDLAEVIGVAPGDPATLSALSEVKERLLARLRDRGYLEARVLPVFEQGAGSRQRMLGISIALGQLSKISTLEFSGFNRSDVAELLEFMRNEDELDQFIKNFQLPRDFLRLSSKVLKEKVGINLEGSSRDESISELKVDLPMDWISLSQSLAEWNLAERDGGYYDLQTELSPGDPGLDMRVRIKLHRGQKYILQFNGNVAYWERFLRQQVVDRSNRLGLPFSLTDAREKLLRLYEALGYRDVDIRHKINETALTRGITFDIIEGPQYFLRNANFEDTFSDPLLAQSLQEWLKPLESPFRRVYLDEKLFRSRLPELVRLFRRKGYLQARILDLRLKSTPNKRFLDLEITAQPGPQLKVRSVVVLGDTFFSDSELDKIVDIPIGAPLDLESVRQVTSDLITEHQNSGFLDVSVDSEESKILRLDLEKNLVDVDFKMELGPRYLVGTTLVAGNKSTKERVVQREVKQEGLIPGEPLVRSSVDSLEQRLLGLGIFSAARVEGVGRVALTKTNSGSAAQQDSAPASYSRDLRISVAEKPGGAWEFGPGFRTDLGAVAFTEFSYRNLGGWNRTIINRAQVSWKVRNYQFPEQKYSITYLEPWLFSDPTRMRVNFSYTKDDEIVWADGQRVSGFNSEEASVGLGLERELSRKLRLTYNVYTLSWPRIFDLVGSNADASSNSGEKYRIGTLGPTLSFDSRDNIFSPRSGWFLSSALEYSGPELGSTPDANFLIFRQSINRYWPFAEGNVLAFALNLGHLKGLGQTGGIPENKRFVLGGRTSVRSLAERSLRFDDPGVLDENSLEFRMEYRQPLFLDFGLAYFFDAGQIWVTRFLSGAPTKTSDLKKGLGVGLRYGTPVGPLALDLAFNPTPDAVVGEDSMRIQFSIGSF